MEWNSKLSILVNHNNDLRQLYDKGYALSIDSGFLVIRDIPYLDEHRILQTGAIISKLIFIDDKHVKQEDHQIFFADHIPVSLMEALFQILEVE